MIPLAVPSRSKPHAAATRNTAPAHSNATGRTVARRVHDHPLRVATSRTTRPPATSMGAAPNEQNSATPAVTPAAAACAMAARRFDVTTVAQPNAVALATRNVHTASNVGAKNSGAGEATHRAAAGFAPAASAMRAMGQHVSTAHSATPRPATRAADGSTGAPGELTAPARLTGTCSRVSTLMKAVETAGTVATPARIAQ